MKCPYRISTHRTISKDTTYNKVYMKEKTVFEECDGYECPFYCDNGTRTTPVCNRVIADGGDNL